MRDALIKRKLRLARTRAGLSQAEVGKACRSGGRPKGISRNAVANWESLESSELPTIRHLTDVAKVCRVPLGYFFSDEEELSSLDVKKPSGPALRWIPVIRWSQIKQYCGPMMSGVSPAEAATRALPAPVACSEHAFILPVRDRSMTSANPLEESYPEDMLIYYDPAASVDEGLARQLVLAWVPGRAEHVFRVLVTDGRERWLEALSPDYGRITGPFEVCAVMFGALKLPHSQPL